MQPTTHNPQLTTIPQHIAIIMDGNRRWSREHKLPALAGHRHVTDKVLEPLVEHAGRLGIKYITFWAWSTENWQRDEREVSGIMRLFKQVIQRQMDRLHQKGVRVRIIGDISQFDTEIRQKLEEGVKQTKNNTTITATFALNYGGRNEVIRAINKLLKSHKVLKQREVTSEDFAQFLDTAGIPDPDLIVRTGGERRLSGFMLWQSEYSELCFVDWYMPEFSPKKLDEILEDYAGRQRRFGR